MPFGEAFAQGLKIVLAALFGFAGGFWILSALFDRRISAREAVMLGVGLFFLMFFSISSMLRGGPGLLILFVGVFGPALLLRSLGRYADSRISTRLNDAEIAKYRQAIYDYPDNPHAHSLLADVYRRLERHELAAQEYEAAL
jgi:tetratricopeptide (TPR) repeat protein